MKFIAFILSIYILALNFTPCEDSPVVGDEFNIEISQNIDMDHDHSDLDLCSPFCQCHCCHIHVTCFNLAELSLTTSEISTVIILHFDSLGKEITNTILQPPKV